MEQRFPQSLLLSSLIHLLVLGLCFLLLPFSTPKPTEKMVTIDLVTWDGPLGDGGHGERAAPKKKIVQVPHQVGRSETRSPIHHPRPKAVPKAPTAVKHDTRDLEAALSERFERERSREAERASALGASEGPDVPQSPGDSGKNTGSNPGGISGTGSGMSGQLATRGIVRRVQPDYPSWAERKWL
ncbi:MAG: hypothetical protein ACM3YO_01050, partial [Bacteroidota bacterium]